MQCLSTRHAVHAPSGLQKSAVAPQSAPVLHWTHALRATLQRGEGAAHAASLVHPARHLSSSRSQMGVEPPQSTLDKHCAQRPVAKQVGADAGQSLFTAHCTHCAVTVLQIARGAAQSAMTLHPRHCPVAVSQSLASPGHAWAPATAHDG